ncbi:hypothetical protein MASR2M29_03500 [Spirochaetota bacterium]
MTNIVLCGGAGTRLWPLSKAGMPKQFAKILPEETLFEATIKRNSPGSFIIASNAEQSELARSQLAGLGIDDYRLVIEAAARNTAPAIALAAMMVAPEETLLVVPSDHLIKGVSEYRSAIKKGTELAGQNWLVTFGIKPGYPETGYGYIELERDSTNSFKVKSFKEKPDLPTAEHYVASGRYFWNSGMFCFKAGVFLEELEALSPEVFFAVKSAFDKAPSKNPLKPDKKDMLEIPGISIDYAVMEKSSRVVCVPCPESLDWSDLGSYDALYDELNRSSVPTDYNGDRALFHGDRAISEPAAKLPENLTLGSVEPVIAKGSGNLVFASSRRVVLAGVDDLIVVETENEVLISRRGNSQSVKDVVEILKTLDPGAL